MRADLLPTTNHNVFHWIVSLVGAVILFGAAFLLISRDRPLETPNEDELLERIRPVGVMLYPEDPRIIEKLADEPPTSVTDTGTVQPPPVSQEVDATLGDTPVVAIVASSAPDPGKATFNGACAACHVTGVAGAPKPGDKDAWEQRLEQGTDQLIQHAIEGFQGSTGTMPAKGGRLDLDDEQIADAVHYMINYSAAAAISSTTAGAAPIATPATPPEPLATKTTEFQQDFVPAAQLDTGAATRTARIRKRVERVSLRPQEEPMSGAAVYEHGCYVCHGPGLTGAPRLDDRREWRRRQRKGREQLYKNAINGFQGKLAPMPPKGGYGYLTDAEIEAAVNYILRSSRLIPAG